MVKPQQLFHFAANISCFSFLNSVLILGFALAMTVGIECGCCSGWLFFDLVVRNDVLIVLLIGSIVYGAYNVLGLLVYGL